jgi:hypothetical protein
MRYEMAFSPWCTLTDGRGTMPVRRTVGFSRAAAAAMLTGLCLALGAIAGCSSGTSTGETAPAKAAVVHFLDAIKRGDDAGARSMLTQVARAKTEELGISVAPPVADSATYAIRDCEMVSNAEDLAHVATTWSDVDETGASVSENVIWVVRLDPEGWRVVGMAMRIFDDMPPLLLNFEDPEDMIAKQEMVAQEMQKRATKTSEQEQPTRTARGAPGPKAVQ